MSWEQAMWLSVFVFIWHCHVVIRSNDLMGNSSEEHVIWAEVNIEMNKTMSDC